MMLGWLKKKFLATQLQESESFLRSLRGADQGVIDMVSAAQMTWAAFYADPNRSKNLYEMESWINADLTFPVGLGSSIRDLQKQKATSSVPGLMVWLHSARALFEPELRLGGRQIWAELAEATDEAESLAFDMCAASGRASPRMAFDRTRIPRGLESLER